MDRRFRCAAGERSPDLTALAAVTLILANPFALTAPALANDSTAELRQGGLVLINNPGVEMRAEDLYISPTAVKVRYRFRNTTDRDQRVLVAFPMPDITVEGLSGMVAVPRDDPENFLGFSTRVEGQPVAANIEQKVFAGGIDRTDYLRSLNVPLAPQLQITNEAVDHLPAAVRDEFVRIGLAIPNDYDTGNGLEHHWQPTWTLKTIYYWDQVFPAGREIAVEHDYVPSVGGTSGTSLESENAGQDDDTRRQMRKYCTDVRFMAAVAKTKRAVGPQHQAYFEKRIDYVLSSGANWGAPIGEFRLVVDKGSPDSLVSFCMDGVKAISPTQFEVRKTDFRPDGDLSILILERAPKGY
jgi:hypothetical protein